MSLHIVCILACAVLQVETVEDYDLYCHYVAGLVGVGLSQLFGECGTLAVVGVPVMMRLGLASWPYLFAVTAAVHVPGAA